MKLSDDRKTLLKVDDSDIKEGKYEIPQEVTSIGARTFFGCRSLQTMILPEEVTFIGAWAFHGCSSLQSMTLPEGVTSIGGGAFANCSRLEVILIEGTAEYIGGITNLLPAYLKAKVLPSEVAKAIFQIRKAQLSRVERTREINLLYRYFGDEAAYLSREKGGRECSKLLGYLFEYMNGFSARDNPYYQEAQLLMHRERLPRNQEEIGDYEMRLKNIADGVIKKAQQFVAEERILIQTFAQQLQDMTKKEEDLRKEGKGSIAEAIKTLRQEIIRSYQKLFKEECKTAIDAVLKSYPDCGLAFSDLERSVTDLKRLFVLEKDIGQQSVTGKNFSFFSTDAPQEASVIEDPEANISPGESTY